nr:HeH/LEM domain-containing protein [Carnobacterium sp. ISL-102]
MTVLQLKEKLDERGIAYKSTDNKATLVSLLEG